MLLNARGVVGALCLLPLAAATVLPREAGPNQLIRIRAPDVERRAPPIVIGSGEETSTSSRSTSSASTVSTPASTSTPVSTPASTPTPTSTTSTPPPPPSSSTSTSRQVTSVISTTDGNGEPVTIFTTVDAPSSSTPSATAASSTNNNDSGPGKGTFIGLGVAGGIALLGLVGFIVWKMNQKRFSQFDDDGADINWPMPKEELVPPAAPSTHAATNATNSSVDLTRDPYAVPPLPAAAMPYYDDPSGGAAYYDPYRGPVPHTFQSPPPSTEGHANTYAGEAIPMSTYPTSGRQSPGPNMIGGDPYARSGSPGPAVAYGDPYAAGRRSPGPAMAYGVPDPVGMRGGTPMGAPPRVGTPVGVGYGPGPGGPIPAGLDIPRTGTPQGGYAMGYGRASPAPPGAGYSPQAPLVDPYGRRTPGAYGP